MPKDIVDNSAKTLHEDLFNQPVKFQPDHIDVDLHIHDIDDLDVTASFHYKDKFPTEPQAENATRQKQLHLKN